MNDILKAINRYMADNSKFDIHRNYLGLSKISGCPYQVFDEYKNGTQPDEQTYRMSYAGYEQERTIFEMLESIGFARKPAQDRQVIIAPFDPRLRGHIDAETNTEDLLEIKSVSVAKFAKIAQTSRSLTNHFIQVQLYMKYGPWKNAWIVYRCRETYEHQIVQVRYFPKAAEEYEAKAKRILAAIDRDEQPACECGKHREAK